MECRLTNCLIENVSKKRLEIQYENFKKSKRYYDFVIWSQIRNSPYTVSNRATKLTPRAVAVGLTSVGNDPKQLHWIL